MLPAAAVISGAYEGDERAFAFGLWAAIGSVAATVGPLLGGFLTTFLSWSVGFGLEAVIVVVIFTYSGRLTKSAPTIGWHDLDVVGFALSAVGFFLIVAGTLLLNDLSAWGLVPILVGASLILLAFFALWQRRRMRLFAITTQLTGARLAQAIVPSFASSRIP
jgi:MFS family permease